MRMLKSLKLLMNALLLCCLLGGYLSTARANAQWQLVKSDEKNNIIVYYRTLADENIEFRGETTVKAPLSSFVALFLDLDSMSKWVYRTQQVKMLQRIGATELYIYTVHNMPIPFRDRDSVNFVRLSQQPATKAVIIKVHDAQQYLEPYPDYVRVKRAVSQWQLVPLGGGEVQVIFSGYGEPGGNISSATFRSVLFQWLVKKFLWQVPHKTLLGLKQRINREQYQQQVFEFIAEP